jgi:hypothetical protein
MNKSGNENKGSLAMRLPNLTGSAVGDGGKVPHVAVETILGDNREAVLLHNGEAYRLRVTANNKLILTK